MLPPEHLAIKIVARPGVPLKHDALDDLGDVRTVNAVHSLCGSRIAERSSVTGLDGFDSSACSRICSVCSFSDSAIWLVTISGTRRANSSSLIVRLRTCRDANATRPGGLRRCVCRAHRSRRCEVGLGRRQQAERAAVRDADRPGELAAGRPPSPNVCVRRCAFAGTEVSGRTLCRSVPLLQGLLVT